MALAQARLLALVSLQLLLPAALALDNGVGLLPPMGWGTWNLFGCWGYNWTENDVRGMADAMVSSGMKDAGYSYINLDGGWLGARDNESGAPYPNPAMFPSGMPALVDYVHSKGLKFGIYRDRHEGLGHEAVDAKQYAKWKVRMLVVVVVLLLLALLLLLLLLTSLLFYHVQVDYLKNDGYGNSTASYSSGKTATQVYAVMRDAINATGRKMVLNIKFDVEPEGFEAAADISNTWYIRIRPSAVIEFHK